MKKYLIASVVLALTLPTLGHAAATANCMMQYQNAKAGSEQVPVFSDHIFRITNDTGVTKAYRVVYENEIMFNPPYYSPNASFEHNFMLNNGQTLQATEQRVYRFVRFSMAGNYQTQAKTTVYMDGKVIASCLNKNVAAIF